MKKTCCVLMLFVCILTQGCEKIDNQNAAKETVEYSDETFPPQTELDTYTTDLEGLDISQELADYREHFIELYSTSALNASNPQIKIETYETVLQDSGIIAAVTKYSDIENHCLRYRVDLYGETMNTVINYYFCDNFIWVSKQSNYYSSWALMAGWDDILFSELTEWIVCEDKMYLLLENGQTAKITAGQFAQEVPAISEIAR